jgi:uncharacterized membrane-anchored protein
MLCKKRKKECSMDKVASLQPVWLQQAIAQGLLPADAQAAADARPWPVVLLTALGAWFAGIFLLIAVGLMVGSWLLEGAGGVFVGPMLLAATVFVLRQPGTPLFVEQLAAPMLWVSGAVLGLGLGAGKIMGLPAIFFVLALVCGAVIMLLPRLEHAWLRLLLGASMAVLLMLVVMSAPWMSRESLPSWRPSPWLMVHVLAAIWVVAMWLGTTRDAWLLGMWQRAHAAIQGWGIAVLAMFIGLSGQTFLLGGAAFGGTGMAGDLAGAAARELTGRHGDGWTQWTGYLHMAVSAVLALLASWLLVRTIKERQQASDTTNTALAAYGVVVVLVAMACYLTFLGGVFLMAVVCIAMRHHKLAVLAAFVAAWIVGSFYYSLALPLATKALVLVIAGALLALLAWWAYRQRAVDAHATALTAAKSWLNATSLGIIASAVLTLGVAGYAIHDKETLIRDGQRIYIPLAPRDPRSLMQGDYMALNFRAPDWSDDFPLAGAQRPYAVGKLSTQGVLELTRLVSQDAQIAADERRVQLTAKDGRWTVVTDAWFFAEGDAQRWEAARFGEFRVLPDGRALLVGMADEKLQAIQAAK